MTNQKQLTRILILKDIEIQDQHYLKKSVVNVTSEFLLKTVEKETFYQIVRTDTPAHTKIKILRTFTTCGQYDYYKDTTHMVTMDEFEKIMHVKKIYRHGVVFEIMEFSDKNPDRYTLENLQYHMNNRYQSLKDDIRIDKENMDGYHKNITGTDWQPVQKQRVQKMLLKKCY